MTPHRRCYMMCILHSFGHRCMHRLTMWVSMPATHGACTASQHQASRPRTTFLLNLARANPFRDMCVKRKGAMCVPQAVRCTDPHILQYVWPRRIVLLTHCAEVLRPHGPMSSPPAVTAAAVAVLRGAAPSRRPLTPLSLVTDLRCGCVAVARGSLLTHDDDVFIGRQTTIRSPRHPAGGQDNALRQCSPQGEWGSATEAPRHNQTKKL